MIGLEELFLRAVAGYTIVFILSLFFALGFGMVNSSSVCDRRVRVDYIFPARQIACFLTTPIEEE